MTSHGDVDAEMRENLKTMVGYIVGEIYVEEFLNGECEKINTSFDALLTEDLPKLANQILEADQGLDKETRKKLAHKIILFYDKLTGKESPKIEEKSESKKPL